MLQKSGGSILLPSPEHKPLFPLPRKLQKNTEIPLDTQWKKFTGVYKTPEINAILKFA